MIRPTLRQLAYLTALQDKKSFSAAAEQCRVTQSTLSAGIKELETIMGQRLINRRARKSSLTPFGLEVAERARRILAETDNLMARARKMNAPLSGIFRLGVIPTIAPYLLPKMLPPLQRRFPDLELQLHEDLTRRLLGLADQGRLDAILMAFPYETPGMTQKILFEEEFVLAAPAQRKTPGKLSIHDLKPDDLLLLEDGHCLRDHALSACQISAPHARKAFSATSLPTLIQMIEHGYGVTLLPAMAAKDSFLTARTRLIPFKSPAPRRRIGLAWPRNGPLAQDALLLAGFLQKTSGNEFLGNPLKTTV